MKYIVLEVNIAGTLREMPFIFPEEFHHDQVAAHMENMILGIYADRTVRPVAAGFMPCAECSGTVSCYGKSETMDLESRGEEDSALIRTHDYLHGRTWE